LIALPVTASVQVYLFMHLHCSAAAAAAAWLPVARLIFCWLTCLQQFNASDADPRMYGLCFASSQDWNKFGNPGDKVVVEFCCFIQSIMYICMAWHFRYICKFWHLECSSPKVHGSLAAGFLLTCRTQERNHPQGCHVL